MSSLAQKLTEERRGWLLRTLAEAPAYRANERLLHDVVIDAGLPCSRDMIRTDLTWLGHQGLVQVDEIAGVMIVAITQGGLDVGQGAIRIPGVSRPDPR